MAAARPSAHGNRPARIKRALLLAALALSLAHPAAANDSSSVLGAGGLVLTKNDAISIQREDLSISLRRIDVRYEMRNDRTAPVTLRVAFPLPDLPVDTPGEGLSVFDNSGEMLAHNIDMPRTRPDFMHFQVTSDGHYVHPEREIQAILPDGRNIVDALREIGGGWMVLHPMVYILGSWPDDVDAESDIGLPNLRKLRALGAVDGDDSGGRALWRTRITFHWMQIFKPGITVIEHHYVPVSGHYLIDWDGDHLRNDAGTADTTQPLDQAFCFDAAARQAVQSAPHDAASVFNLRYILTTGANWAGPIGTFHLTVDGLRTTDQDLHVRMVSLCAELPLQRTSPIHLEGSVQNYLPKSELNVLMFTW